MELTWHWGEDVGTVGQVVGAVELYSAVLVHSPDCDCRPNKDTYVHYTNNTWVIVLPQLITVFHKVSKCKRGL